MKQKRKVKSLLPQKKDWRSSFLTTVLLILSVALCIGSASLITSTVRAVDISSFTYTGLEEKQEVLYGMRFVDRDNMETTVNKMYMKNNSLYITPNPVVVNELSVGSTNFSDSNQVEGVYGHVLGGKGNEVKSNNVTLIAGEDNVVSAGNDNAAFLGGQRNSNFESMKEGGTPMVVVGGSKNSVGSNHDGVALIGGNGNEIEDDVSDSFLLGGEESVVENARNVIVGGKRVKVRNVNNVFVYSNKDEDFEPESFDAFYLNMNGGVGINTEAFSGGLSVKGVVNLGEIDITMVSCNDDDNRDNLGVEGSYHGCIVGCTKAGADVRKWEMLDRGEYCQSECARASNYCVYTGEVIEPAPSYDAFCTSAKTNKDIFTGHSHMCYTGELGEYQDVVYETSLIDSDKECPENNENKCVYQCDEGYHLTGNFAENNGSTVRCYKDCEYTWADGTTGHFKHNETVIGYNTGTVACSNDVYIFPRFTELNNKGKPVANPLYGIKNLTLNGVTYINKAKNGQSPETCGNYDHKKTLVCNNGTMYLTKSDGKLADTSMNARSKGYIYKDCDTANYRCNTGAGEYQFTKTDITKSFNDGGLQDSGEGWKNKNDREQFSLTRGQYKLCLDYNKVDGNNEVCNVVDGGNPHEAHYKFIGCNHDEGYFEFTGEDGIVRCKGQCSVSAYNASGQQETIKVQHKERYEFYSSGSATCTGVCVSQRFECDDGTFYLSGSVGDASKKRDNLNYKNSECGLYDYKCNTNDYNVDANLYEQWKNNGEYISCDDYLNNSPTGRSHVNPAKNTNQNKQCNQSTRHYKLVGCKEGYHTENGKWCVDNVKDMACDSKPSNSHWVRTSGPIQNYPWSNIITKYKTTLNAGWYLVWWDESCKWNDPISSCWVYEYPDGNTDGKVIPGNACEWECDTGYRRDGSICRRIDTSCQYPENSQNACVNTEPYACRDSEHTNIENARLDSDGVTWRWDCVNGIESDRKSCMICKDGYHISGNKCVKNNDGECNNNLDPNGSDVYKCLNGYARNRSEEEDTRYTWDCLGTPSNHTYSDTRPGPDCTAANDDIGCYKCKQGYHKTSTYGECLINECSKVNVPSGDGVRFGTGTPDTHNKSWSYVSSSYLGACQWTCARGYHKVDNGCELNTYTITYDGNGGTPDKTSETVTHGDYVNLPGAEKECYTFDGWDGDWSEGYNYGPVHGDKKFTARWAANAYRIAYDCNGGSGNPGWLWVTFGEIPDVKSSGCSKSYHTLKGWSTDKNAQNPKWELGEEFDGVLISECTDKTLYAVYEKNSCQGPIPANATLIAGSDQNLTANTTRKLYASVAAAGSNKCAYVCDSGFKPNAQGTNCVKISYSCGDPYKCVDVDNGNTSDVGGTLSNHKYERDCGSLHCELCEEGYEDTLHNGTCVNVEEEKPEDGECIFDGTFCSAGDVQGITFNSSKSVWKCLGKYFGEDDYCSLEMRTTETSERCERTNETVCAYMYPDYLGPFDRNKCESAGAYFSSCDNWGGNCSSFGGQCSCVSLGNPVSCYIGTNFWEDTVFGNGGECSYLVNEINSRSYPKFNTYYKHCLKWVVEETKHCFKNNVETYDSECKYISTMNQNLYCGNEVYECRLGYTVSDERGDDKNGYNWKCSKNGKTNSCSKKGSSTCHVKDSAGFNDFHANMCPNIPNQEGCEVNGCKWGWD